VEKKLLKVRLRSEIWRAVHFEALSRGVPVGTIIEDAIELYLALSQGTATLNVKDGATLRLKTIKPTIIPSKPATEPPPEPVRTQTAPTNEDAPSFIKDNPWLTIIARKG
jgi:hypothetical protein